MNVSLEADSSMFLFAYSRVNHVMEIRISCKFLHVYFQGLNSQVHYKKELNMKDGIKINVRVPMFEVGALSK